MNGLSDTEITRILKMKHIPFNGIYSKNQLPSSMSKGWYVVNLQDYNKGNGTHWVAFRFDDICEYFDSFGFLPPVEIEEACQGRKLLYNKKQIQDYNSSACGWFCIACIACDSKEPIEVHFNRFLSRFSNYTKANDIILFRLLVEKGIINW